jgi:hypothetical protein
MIIGSDGGIAISYDGGKPSDALPNMPIGDRHPREDRHSRASGNPFYPAEHGSPLSRG